MAIKVKTLKQKALIPAPPEAVYEALMNSKIHSAFTRHKAVISQKVGGRATAYDGYCGGKNLVLAKGKKIVQTWRAADWPKGHYSKITYLLKPKKLGTEIAFTQAGLPADQFNDMKKGWTEFYWKLLQKYFKKMKKPR